MIFLRQLLPLFFLPVGVCILLVLAGLRLNRQRLIWLGLAVLWVSSTPLASDLMMRAAEGWTERIEANVVSEADAIVVLSGGRVVPPGETAASEWIDADRFFGGLDLFRAGKAPLLIFTGGLVPGTVSEGEFLAGHAKAMGVPPDAILTTGLVTNTAEEARAVGSLLGERKAAAANQESSPRVLLVTSAFHMPRARRLFERSGLTVLPFPVDFQVSASGGFNLLDLLPNAGALRRAEIAWRETYGQLYYSVVQ
jgi:uncharacterized SAM-binding protein YcdF (DUF218 family)